MLAGLGMVDGRVIRGRAGFDMCWIRPEAARSCIATVKKRGFGTCVALGISVEREKYLERSVC